MPTETCPVCKNHHSTVFDLPGEVDAYTIQCPHCGTYNITQQLFLHFRDLDRDERLSHALEKTKETRDPGFMLTSDNLVGFEQEE
jgi:transcription elongation factor Elf1